MKFNLKAARRGNPDYVFIAFLVVLVVFGLVMLMSASSDLGKANFGDSFYFLKHQIFYGLIPGLIGFFIAFFLDYRIWEKISFPALLLSIVFLILVFSPLGFRALGADRWLSIGGIQFQPGELVKLTFLIYMAAWIGKSKSRGKNLGKGFLPMLILLGAVLIPLVLQPATTTAGLIFVSVLTMYFMGGARAKYVVATVALAVIGLVSLVIITPYRMQRVLGFMNPQADPLGKTYQINQTLTAIGSGGLWGVGYGRSTTKLGYLPEPMGDSIFAVIGEELGFVGSAALILFFLLFVWRAFIIAKKAPDGFGRLMVVGFGTLIGLQAFVHVGANTGVIPLTGVPLPFISYGGTALAVFLTMSGIIATISRGR